MEQIMKIDWKYLTFSIVILLSLVLAGVIQLSPPETPESSPQFYFRNSFLALDLLTEETFKGTPGAKTVLLDNFKITGHEKEAVFWLEYGE